VELTGTKAEQGLCFSVDKLRTDLVAFQFVNCGKSHNSKYFSDLVVASLNRLRSLTNPFWVPGPV
jgi:hypothetical protein